jgi:hypothetical protein
MSFTGVVGVVAQAGQAGSVPTGVSIATSSSGNYNNAFVSLGDNCGYSEGSFDGAFTTDTNSDSINDEVTVDVDVSPMSTHFPGCDTAYAISFGAYLRATGATSFAWQLAIASQSVTGSSAAVVGTITTNQNALFSNGSGLGKALEITFGGGRGGMTFPEAGDEIVISLSGTASNTAGDTVANSLSMRFNFIEN